MTYCLAIRLDEGLVFLSDSRTNAGSDQISTYSKMHTWGVEGERHFVLLSAGNLATTQAVVTQVERDINENAPVSLHTVRYLSEAADYLGQLSVAQQGKVSDTVMNAGFNAEATFILGGQIRGETPNLYLLYPQGNYIVPPEAAPFLQTGETKYGKPILDRIIRHDTNIDDAICCALVSMDSTMRSNATVGPPIELMAYHADEFALDRYRKFAVDDPYLRALAGSWNEQVVQAFRQLPVLNWSE